MKNLLLTVVLGLFSLVSVQAADAVNTKCPVSGKDAKKNVEIPVNFCCEKCQEKFDKAPADYLKVIATAEEGKCPLSGKAADKDVSSDLVIGVCCSKCAGKVEADPKAFITKVEPAEKK